MNVEILVLLVVGKVVSTLSDLPSHLCGRHLDSTYDYLSFAFSDDTNYWASSQSAASNTEPYYLTVDSFSNEVNSTSSLTWFLYRCDSRDEDDNLDNDDCNLKLFCNSLTDDASASISLNALDNEANPQDCLEWLNDDLTDSDAFFTDDSSDCSFFNTTFDWFDIIYLILAIIIVMVMMYITCPCFGRPNIFLKRNLPALRFKTYEGILAKATG